MKIFLFFSCLSLTLGLFAQENSEEKNKKEKSPLEMKISLGGGNTSNHLVPIKNWAPFFIELTNNTKEPFEGSIRAIVKHADSIDTYECPVQISGKTDLLETTPSPKKRFYLPLFLKERAYVLSFELLREGKATGCEEYYDVGTLAYGENDRHFLVFSNTPAEQLKYLEQLLPSHYRLDIQQADPEKGIAKDLNLFFYDVVILDKLDNYDLGPSFYEELERYVALGGNLLIGTGETWASVKQHLQSRLFQSHLIDFGKITFPGKKGDIPWTTLIPSSQAQSFFLSKSSFPYLVLESYGNGTVSVLAMDIRYLPEVSEDLLALQVLPAIHAPYFFDGAYNESAKQSFRDDLLTNAESDLSASYRIKLPTKKAIFLYLSLYLFCLVPLNFFFFRFLDRLELAWISMTLMALLFFAGITYYQEQNKLSRFVGTSLSLTQLANQTPYARSLHLVMGYSPDLGYYQMEMASDIPGTLYPANFIPKEEGLNSIWKDQHFTIKDLKIFAGSKRSFLLENFARYSTAPQFQLEIEATRMTGYAKSLTGECTLPFDLPKGFLVYRTNEEYQFFSLNSISASTPTSFQGDWSKKYDKLKFLEPMVSQLKSVSPDFSSFQEKQLNLILDNILREPLRCFFLGFRPSSSVSLTVDQKKVELRSWEIFVADLSAFHPDQKLKGTAYFPEQVLSEENARFPMTIILENNRFLSGKTKTKKRNVEMECEVEYLIEPSVLEMPREILFRVQRYQSPFSNGKFEANNVFSFEVEIWDPKTSNWHYQPLLQRWKSGYDTYFEKRLHANFSMDLKDYLLSPQGKIKMRYKIYLESSSQTTIKRSEQPYLSIEALFPEKGSR